MRLPDDRFFTLHLRAPGLDVEGYSLLSLDKAEEKGKAAAEAMLERRGLLFFVDAEAMSASPAPLASQPHPPSASSEVCDFLRGVSRMESGGTRERELLHEKLFTMSGRPPLGAVIVLASHKEGVTADKLREQLGLDALKSGTHTLSESSREVKRPRTATKGSDHARRRGGGPELSGGGARRARVQHAVAGVGLDGAAHRRLILRAQLMTYLEGRAGEAERQENDLQQQQASESGMRS